MKYTGVTVVMEEAKIEGKNDEGFLVSAGDQTYIGKNLMIATGSSNVIPPLPGIREHLGMFVLINREVLAWRRSVWHMIAASLPILALFRRDHLADPLDF